MKQRRAGYQVVPYPKMRQFAAASFRSVQHKPMMHGLLEVDVTGARAGQPRSARIAGRSATAASVCCAVRASS